MDWVRLLEYGLGTAISLGILGPLVYLLVKSLIEDRRQTIDQFDKINLTLDNHFAHDLAIQKEIAAHMAATNEILREIKHGFRHPQD